MNQVPTFEPTESTAELVFVLQINDVSLINENMVEKQIW